MPAQGHYSTPVSFVWPKNMPVTTWAGGSETYTLRHITELQRRGIPTRLIIHKSSAANMPANMGFPIHIIHDYAELARLDDILVFVLDPPHNVPKLKRQSYVILHIPVKGPLHDNSTFFNKYGTSGHRPIVTSKFMAIHWQNVLKIPNLPPVVYPPIDVTFSQTKRSRKGDKTRILFAGRPTPSKGIYTLLASLHMPPLNNQRFSFTCVKTINNGSNTTKIINSLLEAHPNIQTVEARTDQQSMAALYAQHDIVLMPSLWDEPFGMISVEAQHTGCRVVASSTGGLPETDCGGLLLVEPNNPEALAKGIIKAKNLGPLSPTERRNAAYKFTAKESADALLQVIAYK